MHIVHVGDIAYVAFNLTQHLRERGIHAQLLVASRRMDELYRLKGKEEVLHLQGRKFWNNIRISFEIVRKRRKVDLFHGHGLMNVLLMFAGVPYVAHYHGTDAREVAHSNTSMGKLLRRSMSRARKILISTPDMKQYITNLGIPEEKIVWLPSPIDPRVFKKQESNIDLHGDYEVVLFHPHRFQAVKNNEFLFRAFQRIAREYPGVVLYWVDHASRSPDNDKIRRLIADLNLGEQVKKLPRISPEQMVDYYNATDILMDFFNKEIAGVTLTALEAFLCEKVVVGAITDDPECYVHSSPMQNGNSVDEIEASLRSLFENRQAWDHLGKQGREWVQEHHHPDAVMDRLVGIYREAF